MGVDPDLALAAPDQVVIGLAGIIHGRQFLAKINDVLIAIFPTVEESKCVDNIVGCYVGAKVRSHERT